MLKMLLLTALFFSLAALAACQSESAAGAAKTPDPNIKVSGYLQTGGSSTLR